MSKPRLGNPKRKRPTRYAVEYKLRSGSRWALYRSYPSEAQAFERCPENTEARIFRVRAVAKAKKLAVKSDRRARRLARVLKQDQWLHARAFVMLRDAGRCQRCGALGMEVHHIVKRRLLLLRFDPENLILLCAAGAANNCHGFAESYPVLFGAWFGERYPDRLKYLIARQREAATLQGKIAVQELRHTGVSRITVAREATGLDGGSEVKHPTAPGAEDERSEASP